MEDQTEFLEPEFLDDGSISGSIVDFEVEARLEEPSYEVKKTVKRTKRQRRNVFFTAEDKKLLASAVQDHPMIWDLSHQEHYNVNAVNLAWKEIAADLNRIPSECKTAWIALRESHRYRQRISKKKSGSSGGDPVQPPECVELDWEFAEDLAFLPNVSKKRRTLTSTEADSVDVENQSSSVSNYSYQSRPTGRSKSQDNESVSRLAENISQFIEQTLSTSAPSTDDHRMINHVALANVDRMLQQLPATIAEDAIFEITSLLYAKIQQNRLSND